MKKSFSGGIALVLMLLFIFGCEKSKNRSSDIVTDPLTVLTEGNKRFAGNNQIHPDESPERKKQISDSQKPFAAIVCCSDSRVPPEIIFDQGLGDLFVIRTAGNLIGDIELGSLEYALEHLNVKLVMVLGHQHCGVIKAFLSEEKESGNIAKLVSLVSVEEEEIIAVSLGGDKINNCVLANIEHGVKQIKSAFHELLNKNGQSDVKVVGAEYDLHSGNVEIVF